MLVSEYEYLKAKKKKEIRERNNRLKNNYIEISDSEAKELKLK